jgi:hypothetical protein
MMKRPAFAFLRNLLVFSVILYLLSLLITRFLPSSWVTPAMPWLFVFFFLATLFIRYVLGNIPAARMSRFINFYLIITTVKLLVYFAVMIVYAFLNRSDAVPFIITFFILYVCYTLFEVVAFLRTKQE